MPTVYAFFVIDCEKLSRPMSVESMQREAAVWATVESRAFDGFEHIDRAFGRNVTGNRYGAFSREKTATLATELGSATADVLAKIEENPLVAQFYWAMRNTAEEASRRGCCMSVRYTADPEEEEVAQQEQEEDERQEDMEAAAAAIELIAPQLPTARQIVDVLVSRQLISLKKWVSCEEIARHLAERGVDRGGDVGTASELAEWLMNRDDIDEVFGDDEAIRSALEHVT